jgi:hypothetical protein
MEVQQTDRLRLGRMTARNVVFIVCSVTRRHCGTTGSTQIICTCTLLLNLTKLHARRRDVILQTLEGFFINKIIFILINYTVMTKTSILNAHLKMKFWS